METDETPAALGTKVAQSLVVPRVEAEHLTRNLLLPGLVISLFPRSIVAQVD
jgi:hypothetical protein